MVEWFYKLIDTKQLGKFCEKFTFSISKCIANLSLIVSSDSWGWTTQFYYGGSYLHNHWPSGGCTTQLISSHYSLVIQDYLQASLNELQNFFCRDVIGYRYIEVNLLSYPPFYTITSIAIFAKIVNVFQPLTILAKSSIVDVLLGSKYFSVKHN